MSRRKLTEARDDRSQPPPLIVEPAVDVRRGLESNGLDSPRGLCAHWLAEDDEAAQERQSARGPLSKELHGPAGDEEHSGTF